MLSDQGKRDSYDQLMGFGRAKQFTDHHFASQKAVYSDDEYENLHPDRRTKPFGGMRDDQGWK